MISAETYNHDYEVAYKQGVADGIDKCIEEINRLNIEIAYPHTICNILEMLKEQNNG